jgi:hypothetical protein
VCVIRRRGPLEQSHPRRGVKTRQDRFESDADHFESLRGKNRVTTGRGGLKQIDESYRGDSLERQAR